jgi:hypothetical protein
MRAFMTNSARELRRTTSSASTRAPAQRLLTWGWLLRRSHAAAVCNRTTRRVVASRASEVGGLLCQLSTTARTDPASLVMRSVSSDAGIDAITASASEIASSSKVIRALLATRPPHRTTVERKHPALHKVLEHSDSLLGGRHGPAIWMIASTGLSCHRGRQSAGRQRRKFPGYADSGAPFLRRAIVARDLRARAVRLACSSRASRTMTSDRSCSSSPPGARGA